MIEELKGIPQRIMAVDKSIQPERAWNEFLEWCITAWCPNSPYPIASKEYQQIYLEIFFDMAKAQEMLVNLHGANDLFGELYEEFFQSGMTKHLNGQFFTPQSLADLCAKVSIDESIGEFGTINDCACGSGRMLVAVAKESNKHFFCGEDLDVNSVKMCTLNFLMNGMTGFVTHQDTLRMKKFGGFLVNWGLNGEPFEVAGRGVPSILYIPSAYCHEVNKRLYSDMYVAFHTGKMQGEREKGEDKVVVNPSSQPRKVEDKEVKAVSKVKNKAERQRPIQYTLF